MYLEPKHLRGQVIKTVHASPHKCHILYQSCVTFCWSFLERPALVIAVSNKGLAYHSELWYAYWLMHDQKTFTVHLYFTLRFYPKYVFTKVFYLIFAQLMFLAIALKLIVECPHYETHPTLLLLDLFLKWHHSLGVIDIIFLIWRGRMANFKGHALPGTFFLLFGLWWSIKCPYRQKRKRERNGERDSQTLTLLFNRIDLIEGVLKIFFAFVGELQSTWVTSHKKSLKFTKRFEITRIFISGWTFP